MARADARVRLLMSAPGVGPIVALTYVSAIDDPTRFKCSKGVAVLIDRILNPPAANGCALARGVLQKQDTTLDAALRSHMRFGPWPVPT